MAERRTRLGVAAACLLALLAAASPALAQTVGTGSSLGTDTVSAITRAVKDVSITATGASLTLADGQKVNVDLSGAGKPGGGSLVPMATLFFGIGVLSRLMMLVRQVLGVFAPRPRRHRDEYE